MPEEDTYSYKGWLTSDSFWKRMLAVWGYILAGYAIVAAIIILLAIIAAFMFGFMSGLAKV
jgi:hypothetical protein